MISNKLLSCVTIITLEHFHLPSKIPQSRLVNYHSHPYLFSEYFHENTGIN